MKIVVGADHRGRGAMDAVAEKLTASGHEVVHAEGCSDGPCDYPVPAYYVGRTVASGQADRGVLICGTGIGVSIAANKVAGVRAALVSDDLTAELSRTHNDANVICLSADLLSQRQIEDFVVAFMRHEFEGGRHARRLERITAIEAGGNPEAVETTA
ncbi:MAG: RpiB/LacA/LacB family sugar-phosphate isomerase [Planctomycetota bacterium]